VWTTDQSETIAFLASPATHGGAEVRRIDTHASVVFLAGSRAWKLKRAVRYDYLDFSTVERRRAMCEAELRINRRIAPGIYAGVRPVTREPDGSLALGGSGTPVDWVLEMARFDEDGLFDRLASTGRLDLDIMHRLAVAVAALHLTAETRHDHGGAAGMAWVIDGNEAGFAEEGRAILDPSACAQVTLGARRALDDCRARLEARRAAGFVRQCHGDLHLRNIVLVDGQPTPFDAVEFNDEIACIDVYYDLAFLLMDLWRRGLPRHANVVLNGYLAATGDIDGLALLPLFLSCRAAVRAKTSATSARLQGNPQGRRELEDLAREYLDRAGRLLQPPRPSLVAVGGLSGSGKSTLALALAPAVGAVPGAIVIRSDEIRKRLCGVSPLVRLGPEGYAPEVSRKVYAATAEQARPVLRAGHSAIVDAVFARPEDREAIARVALSEGVPFVGFWLDAPPSVLMERTTVRTGDASDADSAVVARQVAQDVGPIAWRRLDAVRAADAVLEAATSALAEALHAPALAPKS
jgi:aminoglycoside phosphotransferase family enzyme/predicted kinase